MKSRKLLIALILAIPVLLFIGIQLIPVWLFQRNPPVVQEPAWDSPETRALAVRACYDCHSNETVWPWYSRVAPVSWLVTFDTVRGRLHLNFSTFGTNARFGEESGEREITRVIQRGEMPPSNYLLLHPEAELTPEEKALLVEGLKATFGQ